MQVQVIGLPGTDILRTSSGKMKVGTELAVAHFGVDFRHFHVVGLSFTLEAGGEAGHHPLHIMFVNLGLHLQFGGDDLPDTFPLGDRLPYLCFEITQLAADGRFHLQVLQPFADEGEAPFHVPDILIQALQLAAAEKVVLADTLV